MNLIIAVMIAFVMQQAAVYEAQHVEHSAPVKAAASTSGSAHGHSVQPPDPCERSDHPLCR